MPRRRELREEGDLFRRLAAHATFADIPEDLMVECMASIAMSEDVTSRGVRLRALELMARYKGLGSLKHLGTIYTNASDEEVAAEIDERLEELESRREVTKAQKLRKLG